MTLDTETILIAVLAGAAIGALYMSLLRAGTRALAGSHPLRDFVALAVLRGGLVLGALAGLAALGADAPVFIGALAGFVAARVAVTRMVGGRGGRVARWR